MKKKEKLNYMLRAVYNNEDCPIKRLKSYCMVHRVTVDEEEFSYLLNELKNRRCVEVDMKKQAVIFRKGLVKDGISAGVLYNGTYNYIFFDPTRNWIQPMI